MKGSAAKIVPAVGIGFLAITFILAEYLHTRPELDRSRRPNSTPQQFKKAIQEYAAKISSSAPGSPEPPAGSPAAKATRLVYQRFMARADWWSKEPGSWLGPPLPVSADFWRLVADLKDALGAEAAPVLAELLDSAASPQYKRLYTALLAGLKSPAAEKKLASLAADVSLTRQDRGLALYGLGLLATPSAWDTARKVWEALDKDDQELRIQATWGLGAFGNPAIILVIKEADTAAAKGMDSLATEAIRAITGDGAVPELKKLLDHSSAAIREGALRALTDAPTGPVVDFLMEYANQPEHASRRDEVLSNIGASIREGKYSFASSPELKAKIVAGFDKFPLDVQLDFYTDPALRTSLPPLPPNVPVTEDQFRHYVWALSSDPSMHGRLATLIASKANAQALGQAFVGLSQVGAGFDDPALASALKPLALELSPESTSVRDFAWRTLSLGSLETRAEALAEVPLQYSLLRNDLDRMNFAGSLRFAGRDANVVLLDLLGAEPNPLPKMEIAATLLSIPGNMKDPALLSEMQPLISSTISNVLSGQLGSEALFPFIHPGRDNAAGLDRFGALLRDLFSAYGTPEQIPELETFALRLSVPPYVTKNDAGTEKWLRSFVHQYVLESIDAIRARSGP